MCGCGHKTAHGVLRIWTITSIWNIKILRINVIWKVTNNHKLSNIKTMDTTTSTPGRHVVHLAHLEPIKYVVPAVILGIPFLVLVIIAIKSCWQSYREDPKSIKIVHFKPKNKKKASVPKRRPTNTKPKMTHYTPWPRINIIYFHLHSVILPKVKYGLINKSGKQWSINAIHIIV